MATRPQGVLRPIPTKGFCDLKDRGISAKTAKRFGVSAPTSGPDAHLYPYTDGAGNHVANKVRCGDGSPVRFRWEGDHRNVGGLFGQGLFPAGSAKQITITEGECDALAVYEMMGDFPVVSVQSAGSAVKDVTQSYEYLNSFDTIVICFDKDEAKIGPDGLKKYPGQEAAHKVASLFRPGKCRVLTLSEYKDANDYLLAKKQKQFAKEWWSAPAFTPDGLVMAKDLWDEISNPPKYETIPYPWQGLQAKTYGLRLSELTIVTAETGIGKTSILKEFEHHIMNHQPEDGEKPKIGLMHLEEPKADTALGLMSISANKPLHLPDVREATTKEELREYFDATLNNDQIVVWDHFGSNDIEEVLRKVEHMHVMGCKYIVVDHLSIIVSDQRGDERKQLDEITTKLKTKCMELNIAVIAVVHVSRNGMIRGSAGIEQLANTIIRLERDKNEADDWRRNVTKMSIEKNRFSGQTGPACWLHYNLATGRLKELEPDEVQVFEAGESMGEVWDE